MVAIAQQAEGGDVELQPGGDPDVQVQPAHGHGAKDVSVCEDQHPAAGGGGEANEFEGS